MAAMLARASGAVMARLSVVAGPAGASLLSSSAPKASAILLRPSFLAASARPLSSFSVIAGGAPFGLSSERTRLLPPSAAAALPVTASASGTLLRARRASTAGAVFIRGSSASL